MKNILFFLLISTCVYSQGFQENFNSGIPSTWLVTNNGIGVGQNWSSSPPASGNNSTVAAFVANETATVANPVQDWLISPQINLNSFSNPSLKFYGKVTPVAPNRNSVLKVMISTTGTNFSDFQLLETFNETYTGSPNPISPNNNFNLKQLDLSSYSNANVYLAFVMENTGIGKVWYVDDVSVENQCLNVTNIEIINIGINQATVNWTDPGNSNSYQIELVEGNNQPTGVANFTSNIPTYTIPNLNEGIVYKVYIRSICSNLNADWVASSEFQVAPLGSDCNSPISILSLPFVDTKNTVNYPNNYTGSPGNGCGIINIWEPTDYLFGNDVVYAFTPTTSMEVNIEMVVNKAYTGFFIYDDCDNIGINCIGGSTSNTTDSQYLNNLSLNANTTYYILVSNSSFAEPQDFEYTLNIQQVFCPPPVSLSVNQILTNSATLSWINGPGSNANSWEVFVKEVSPGLPLTSGTSVSSNSFVATQITAGQNLEPNTEYEFYIRSSCGNGNFSPWGGPKKFKTACLNTNLPFFEGFNSDSTTQSCWTIVNANNDEALWNLDSGFDPFEGDEVAILQAYTWNEDPTNDDWLISPRFIVNGQYRLKYNYKVDFFGDNYQPFEVKMSTTDTEISSFNQTLVPQENYSNLQYLEKTVYLPVTSGNLLIGWHVPNVVQANIYIDNIIIEPVPSCPEPYDVTAISTTENSITLDWAQFGTTNSWDVITIPAPNTLPDDLTGITIYNTTTKPFTIPNLNSGSFYNIYVRANCSSNQVSNWSYISQGMTLISNNECVNSTNVPVNPGIECVESVTGTLIGATASNLGDVCSSDIEVRDVWYNFNAVESTHMIRLVNMSSVFEDVYIVVYSGDCDGNLTQVACSQNPLGGGSSSIVLENLVPDQQYLFKVYSSEMNTQLTYEACVITPDSPLYVSESDYTIDELVKDVLVGNPCLVSNITWRTGTNFDEGNGISYFNKNNSSFAFAEGIVLSTGDFSAVAGPASNTLESGGSWVGDDDLLDYMQNQGLIVNTYNDATVLEFDFIPTHPNFSFDFIFASNEYGQFQCNYSDAFAFFLTDLNTNITTNLALVPGSNAPISVTTIRNELHSPIDFDTNIPLCPSDNETYFDKCFDPNYNGLNPLAAPINFKGYTVPMTAQATVVPGTSYHIKMVIADRDDSAMDSAVFLLGGSFDIGNVDLGSDLTIETNNALCSGQTHLLQAQIDTQNFSIKWFKNDDEISGQNTTSLLVEESGTYRIEATFLDSECKIIDEIVVEIYPSFKDDLGTPKDIQVCKSDSPIVDLTINEIEIFNVLNPQDFTVEYYNSLQDSQNGINKINNFQNYDYTNNTQVFVKIINKLTSCVEILNFKIDVTETVKAPDFNDVEVCTHFKLPDLPANMTYHSLANGQGNQYQQGQILGQGEYKIYIFSNNQSCADESDFNVKVKACSVPKGISPNNDNLNDNFDLSFYNVEKISIFNRYGVEVYSHGKGYTNQWSGQDRGGKELPSGTYFYKIVTPFETFTGWVQLVREGK